MGDSIKQNEKHYEFGKNWTRFLEVLDARRIGEATISLKNALGLDSMEGMTFLDAGCGSGLFSLCAKNLGATVHSFDYDIHSVNCAKELKLRYHSDRSDWHIEQGDILSEDYISSLGQFDIVYSWGVLHHTGNMYGAFNNIKRLVKYGGGVLFISIYNDQRFISKFWRKVKQAYNRTPRIFRFIFIVPYFIRYLLPHMMIDTFTHFNPMYHFSAYKKRRGMSVMYDVYDWLGGYPFEVAKPEEVFDFFFAEGFHLVHLTTCGGRSGCNEFVFKKGRICAE